ncbi:LAQU0S08e04940g1_1 [Lachancea quebecensis]|uniref:LAQU0S08e04940g1_1 n=1 Tax=Lachancea quebecensis TaxID=1654605 RepID=A0A0P1KTS0_9SACH|nr:LAQU0S08e04940g1_1 [Lachancea quebecensis]
MNLFQVSDFYIDRIVNSKSKSAPNGFLDKPRIKALLLDKDTTGTISMCTTQSELLEHEVYLIDTLENQSRDAMRHLKCLVYAKPTDETIEHLVKELQDPKYGEYQIFFNNTVTKTQLERLAESDDLEVVSKVEEVFQDYQVLNQDLFSLDVRSSKLFSHQMIWDPSGLADTTHSIISLLLSLKVKPLVRYEAGSRLTSKLAKEVMQEIHKNERALFDFPVIDSPPLLLILDRYQDPLTPLLQPWTYQSMINEYIGIKRNVVDLSKVPDIDDSLEQVVLSSKQDPFFHDTMYLNFGELGDKVKQYVSSYKDKTKSNTQINTIEDIKRFIGKFPEFKKLSGNVSKHMAIVSELDRQLQVQHVWDVSEVEQNISAHTGDSQVYQDLKSVLSDERISGFYKLKLACIYSLRNATSPHMNEVSATLAANVSPEELNFFHHFNSVFQTRIKNANNGKEREDLISELAKKFNQKGQHKSDNVFMQHVPDLSAILSDLSKNKLPEDRFPFLEKPGARTFCQDVIIFHVGGTTFEEARIVHQFNSDMAADAGGKTRVILGGTTLLNTREFLNDCREVGQGSAELTDLL